MTELDLLVNASYVILIVSFLMRDILWLRVLNVVSVLFEVAYFYLQPAPLWPVIGWNLALVAVNAYWITRLTLERRPVHFSPEDQRLYDKALRPLKPRHARKLLDAGQRKTVQAGEQVVAQGHPLNTLSLIAGGKFKVERDDVLVDEIGEGRFVGSVTFLKNIEGFPSPVTFTAAEPSRVVSWENDALKHLIGDDTELAIAVEASLGLELARLLDHAQDDLEFALLNRGAKASV
jgi:CRP-like cAMP-binding protein